MNFCGGGGSFPGKNDIWLEMLSLIGVGQGEKDYKNEGAINWLKGTYLGMIRCGSSIEENA